MAKRKGIGNTKRFEIFKRDGFSCQYCGRTPPVAILELDHITPVSKGGDNDPLNLITSCFECNRGKRDHSLTSVPESLKSQVDTERERRAQIELYNEFLMEIRSKQIKDIEDVGYYWFNHFEKEKDSFVFGSQRRPSISRFLSLLPKAEILDSIDIAMAKFHPYGGNDNKTFQYFCGICWNKINKEKNPNG